MEYKRAYAKTALAAGLTKPQIVRIYAFESGGNGSYDVQAGLEYNSPGARAINSALGYNQLLNTNSVELLAEKGDRFIDALKARAAGSSGETKAALERKIDAVRRMIAFSRTVPDDWNEHDKLANTPRASPSTPSISTSMSVRCCRPRSSSTPSTSPAARAIPRP